MSAMASRPIIAVLDKDAVIAGLLWERPPYSLLIRPMLLLVNSSRE
jgi:hypothetical protein